MTPFFASIIIASFILFILIRTVITQKKTVTKVYFNIYAIVICGILCCQILYFIGFKKYETPRLPLHRQRAIVHLGYYIAPDFQFVFNANGTKNGFGVDLLSDREKITFTPIYENRAASQWNIQYNSLTYPLRIDNRCVNVSKNAWFNHPRDAFYILVKTREQKENYFISFKYWQNSFYLNCGIVRQPGGWHYHLRDALALTFELKEGITIDRLLHLSTNNDIKKHQQLFPPALKRIFNKIIFVREIKDNRFSPIGILTNNRLLTDPVFSFFMNDKPLAALREETQLVVSCRDSIFYGFGSRSMSIGLSQYPSLDERFGNLLECRFKNPKYYPLPPDIRKPFIITNDNSHILLDGYYFDMGINNHSFYANASFPGNLDALFLNDGKIKNHYKTGDIIRFGNRRLGVLLSFNSKQPAVSYTGIKSVGIIILLTILFIALPANAKGNRVNIDLCWTIIWGMTLTLLVFRLIQAFRVSLLPPMDASAKIQGIFHKSLTVSFWGLIFIPTALILIRLISKLKILNWFENILSRGIFTYLLFFLLPYIIIAAKFLKNKGTLLDFRVNIGVHILLIVVLVFSARSLVRSPDKRTAFCGLLIITFSFVMIIIKDAGFIVNGISLGLTVIVLFSWNPGKKRRRLLLYSLVIGMFFLLLWGVPYYARHIARCIPQEKHWHYRMLEDQNNLERILLEDSKKNAVKMRLLLRNAHQRWQMLLYAAEGARQPGGFGNAPMSNRGMTYPAALTDCFYSYFVLSEYGTDTGILLIILYLTLGFTMVYASGFFQVPYRCRMLPLTAIGLFFIVNSLYIASANIGILPFSGINMPLFGLYSRSDLVQGGVLLMLAIWLLGDSIDTETRKFCENQKHVTIVLLFILLGLFAWIGTLYFHMDELKTNNSYIEDFNFSSHFYDTLEKNLSTTRNNSISVNPHGHGIEYKQSGGFLTEMEELFIHRFNQLDNENKFRKKSLYYLEKEPGSKRKNDNKYRLRVNRHYFVLSSPFRVPLMWQGVIFGDSPIKGPSITALGKPFLVTLSGTGHAQSAALDAEPPSVCNRMILITENHLRNSHIICELLREKQHLYLIPRSKTWSIYVEDQKIEKKFQLQKHNIIVFSKNSDPELNWFYLGNREPVLAYTRWRNGKMRRIFPYGSLFAMPYTLAKALDSEKSRGKKLPQKLELSIDVLLQQMLQKVIREFAANDIFYRANSPIKTPKIAVTVMDAFSGQIIALPSYPDVNPVETNFEKKVLQSSPREQVRLLTNFNLLNHENGSTFKPHILTAVSTTFWPEFNIGKLVIHNHCANEQHREQICLHTHIGNIPLLPWDSLSTRPEFDTKDFLVLSEDYGIIIGWLGFLLKKEDLWRVLAQQVNQKDFVYKNKGYNFDLTRLEPEFSPFSLEDTFPRITSNIEKSLLFKALNQLFDFHISEDYYHALRRSGEAFLPSFKNFDFKKNIYLNNVVPEPVIFNPRFYQYNRGDLISFCLGGGPNRINNIAMAQSAARIATGRKVAATLEKKNLPPVMGNKNIMPPPLSLSEWRNENLVFPLELVGKTGTANTLKDLVEPPLKVLYKTGTIIKTEKNGRESETLLFVIGQWNDNSFVKGKTLAGFLYMEESKERKKPQKKFQLARPIIKALANYLNKKNEKKYEKWP